MDLFFILCAKYLFVIPFLIAAIFFIKQQKSVQVNILLFGLICALASYTIALLLGKIYFDPRPFVVGHFKPLIEHDTENGFPSDHVLLVSCVSAVMTVFSNRLWIWCWICTFLISISRVYVGVHHIIDVLASIIIAVGITYLVYVITKKRFTLQRGSTNAPKVF